MNLFQKAYWKSARHELKKPVILAYAALICALCIVTGSLFVPVGENLRVYFTYIFKCLGAAVFGPIIGVLAAFVTDTVGFILFPSGAYFPGYLLSEILGFLIYSLMLYKQKISFLRLLIMKALVNYLVNVLLGSLWSSILFGKAYLVYFSSSIVKNSLLLPIETIVLTAVFAAICPILVKQGFISKEHALIVKKK